jgi:hypothetical protein
MKLETKIKQLVAQLPVRQQTLDFGRERLWQGLTADDQESCRKAIAHLLIHVVLNENESSEDASQYDEENSANE